MDWLYSFTMRPQWALKAFIKAKGTLRYRLYCMGQALCGKGYFQRQQDYEKIKEAMEGWEK